MPFFVTIYPNYWGRGKTPEESKKQAKKAGGSGIAWATFQLPVGSKNPYVNDWGEITWAWRKGFPKENQDTNSDGYHCKVIKHGSGFKQGCPTKKGETNAD